MHLILFLNAFNLISDCFYRTIFNCFVTINQWKYSFFIFYFFVIFLERQVCPRALWQDCVVNPTTPRKANTSHWLGGIPAPHQSRVWRTGCWRLEIGDSIFAFTRAGRWCWNDFIISSGTLFTFFLIQRYHTYFYFGRPRSEAMMNLHHWALSCVRLNRSCWLMPVSC